MTEARKKIIELIEPFMYKAFNKWCWVKTEQNDEYIQIEFTEKNIRIWDIVYYWDENYTLRWYRLTETNHKVLWHYDITAVLKYINLKINWEWSEYFLYIYNEKILIYNKFIKDVIKINPKPLHLYTEQEDQDLLDLLTKLQ